MISNNPKAIPIKEIGRHFKLKVEYLDAPSQYLGGNLIQVTMENVKEFWAFGSTEYVRAAKENFEEYLVKKGEKLATKALTPPSNKYRPGVDIIEELADEEAYY